MGLKEIIRRPGTWTLGALVGTITYALSLIWTMLVPTRTLNFGNYVTVTGALVDINVRNQIMSSGVANALGAQVLKILNYVPKWNWGEWIGIVIGSIALVIIGKAIYQSRFSYKNARMKLSLELFYGAVVFTGAMALIGGVFAGFPMLVLNMLVYYILVGAIIIPGAAKLFPRLGRYLGEA